MGPSVSTFGETLTGQAAPMRVEFGFGGQSGLSDATILAGRVNYGRALEDGRHDEISVQVEAKMNW
jgi:hypothetical protein